MIEKNLQSNIWKYTLFLITNKRVFLAILGAYYLTIPGVTPEGIGIILLIGSFSQVIFEIPSGYLSDKIGHKTALVLSRLFMLASTLFFLFANSIGFLILGGVFMSIGYAFFGGTGNAFMYETLQALKRENEYAKIMGKISSIGLMVPIIFIVLTPFLVSISFKAPFVVALVFNVIGIIAAALLVSPSVPQEKIKEIQVTKFKQVVKEGCRLNFFVFALFSGIIAGVVFGIEGFRAPYQVFLEVPVIWYGVLFGLGRMFASLLTAYSGKIRERVSLFGFYRFQLIFYTLLILTLGFISSWQVAVATFIVIDAVRWGLNRVDNSYLIDIIKTSKFKSTLLSIQAQIIQIIAAIASFGIGFTIERLSYQYGFIYLGLIFIVILLPLYLYIVSKHKSVNAALVQVK
ncbi:MAG: MFS transporter [Candidatus Campbellbacteria bacterium]|nr:MFS transporter [Candidatus Campbellbacteria bacterium]